VICSRDRRRWSDCTLLLGTLYCTCTTPITLHAFHTAALTYDACVAARVMPELLRQQRPTV
jgi:hypothetical protein